MSLDAVFRSLPGLLSKHFHRERGSLGPFQVFVSLMFMSILGTKGYQRTLDDMKTELGRVLGWHRLDHAPSPSALCQARRKLDIECCNKVMSQIYDLCSTARKFASLGYSGFRILAIDGTKLILPAYSAFEKHFGCPTSGHAKKSGPQASLTVLWDVGANQPVDWRLGPNRQHERVQALELMDSLKPGDLLLADRGFPSRQLLHDLLQRKIQFLMRIRCDAAGSLREVVDFAASPSSDAIVSLVPRIHGIRQLDLPGITVRLLRHVLPDGSSAIFVTSLCDEKRHLSCELIKLYSQRWRIETAFREMKIWHGLERFHARHVDGIAQEVCALMVFQLLSSELAARVEHHHKLTLTTSEQRAKRGSQQPMVQQLPIRFNRRIVADCVVDLLRAGAKSAAELQRVFKRCLFTLWRYRQKPRPDRSFPRERKSTSRGWKSTGGTK